MLIVCIYIYQIYGELVEGLTAKVAPLQAKSLLKPDCPILNLLGR